MFDIKFPIDLSAFDLGRVLPLLALVAIAALILFILLARSIVRSRLIAVVILATVIAGSSAFVVGGLNALTWLIGVAGGVMILSVIVLGRHPIVIDLLHSLISPKTSAMPSSLPSDQPARLAAYIEPDVDTSHESQSIRQLPALTRRDTPSRRRVRRGVKLPKNMGF